jgi:CRISPR/Cas system CMR-associated protein Cmr3 (group 5 of RAMP superfamily)
MSLPEEIRKQRSILESAIKKIDDVYIPHEVRSDKMQSRLDGTIAGLQLLVSDLTDALIANMSPEELG